MYLVYRQVNFFKGSGTGATNMYHKDNSKSGYMCELLEHLYNISNKLTDLTDINEVIKFMLKILAEKLEMQKVMISIYNRKTGEIMLDEAFGLSEEEVVRGKYLPGEGITGRVVETGRYCIIPKISEEPEFLDRTGSRAGMNKDDISFICFPVKIGSEVIGTISADRPRESVIPLDDIVRFFSILSAMISQAVHLHRLKKEELQELQEENRRLQSELKEKFKPSNIIGKSKSIREVYRFIEKVSQTNASILILGESGVGKELVANAIHYNSKRADKPFIKFNCAALTESIIESELFGHEKGSFSGAIQRRIGKFEQADGGTIFLDEIAEISPTVQVKLLRVLQEKELERVGGTSTVKIDVRIITATNRDLAELIKENKFREDIFYRLNTFPIAVPPLRERKTDILLLAEFFLEKFNRENGKNIRRISTAAIDMLMSYHWPGNVRELGNCIERAVILSEDKVIHSYHLPATLQTAESSNTKYKNTLENILAGVEKEMIIEALKNNRGNMAKAAAELGITERIIGLRVNKYGINPRKYKTRPLGD